MVHKILVLVAACLAALLSLSLSRPVVATATVPTFNGTDWGCVLGVAGGYSTSQDEFSHRSQGHTVETSDGVIHAIVNNGATDNNALQICTSIDGGLTWVVTYTYPNTTINSTTHVVLLPGSPTLQVSYDTHNADGSSSVVYETRQFSNNVWSVGSSQTVIATAGVVYTKPAFTTDTGGTIWMAAETLITKSNTPSINLYTQGVGSTTWAKTGLVFKNASGVTGPLHSPRPVLIPSSNGNVGLIYQGGTCLYWVSINGSNVSSIKTLTSSLPPAQKTIVDTAYSLATDNAGNQYLTYVKTAGASSGIYARTFDATQGVWGPEQYLSQGQYANTAVYSKVSLVTTQDGVQHVCVFINTKGSVAMYTSPAMPSPTNYVLKAYLVPSVPASGQGITPTPRIDTPALLFITDTIPTIPMLVQVPQSATQQTVNIVAVSASVLN